MKKLNSQSGRSMVEILGVLAIIGVLSVGGIAGYSLSMRRHRANQIVDYFSKYALIIYGKCQQEIANGDSYCAATYESYCADEDDSRDANVPDLGPLPAGVREVYTDRIWTDSGDGKGDHIDLVTFYYDKKLCQTIASITDSTCNSNSTWPYLTLRFNLD